MTEEEFTPFTYSSWSNGALIDKSYPTTTPYLELILQVLRQLRTNMYNVRVLQGLGTWYMVKDPSICYLRTSTVVFEIYLGNADASSVTLSISLL